MTGRSFAVGLAAISAFLLFASQADADVLELNCTYGGQIWIDMDRSTATLKFPDGFKTLPAQISATEIVWSRNDDGWRWDFSVDRTTGHINMDQTGPGGSHGHGDGTCEKGTTPLPATKF